MSKPTIYNHLVPAGSVFLWGGASMPAGFLLCNGAEVSKTEYNALYEAIEDEWGTASDSGNFKLPDMRDCFPEGAGTYGVGAAVGASLPNITGFMNWRTTSGGNNMFWVDSSLYTVTGTTESDADSMLGAGSSNGLSRAIFNASGVSSIYSDSSNTVQPQSKVFSYIIKY